MLKITVSDIKQYTYCPRVVFFTYLQPVDKKTTYKMEVGQSSQEIWEKLESRRKLKKYHLEEGERVFNFFLASSKLGLTGKLDLYLWSKEGLFPVEFKHTTQKPQRNHLHQLAAYALLLEEKFNLVVKKGFVYMIPVGDIYVFDLTQDLKEEVLGIVSSIQEMISREQMPEKTKHRNKCNDCEYQNFCGDVF